MNPTTEQSIAGVYSHEGGNLWTRFIGWSERQQKNNLMWMAVAIAGHGCIISPITILAVMLSGHNNMFYWSLVLGSMCVVLIANLAALPTKWTIPIFALSLLVDLGVIIAVIATSVAGV